MHQAYSYNRIGSAVMVDVSVSKRQLLDKEAGRILAWGTPTLFAAKQRPQRGSVLRALPISANSRPKELEPRQNVAARAAHPLVNHHFPSFLVLQALPSRHPLRIPITSCALMSQAIYSTHSPLRRHLTPSLSASTPTGATLPPRAQRIPHSSYL